MLCSAVQITICCAVLFKSRYAVQCYSNHDMLCSAVQITSYWSNPRRIKAGGRIFRYEVHKLLFLSGIRRNCLRSGRSRPFYLSRRGAMKRIVVITGAYHFVNCVQNFTQRPAVKVNFICRGNCCHGVSKVIK
jgi:hypothetical protein